MGYHPNYKQRSSPPPPPPRSKLNAIRVGKIQKAIHSPEFKRSYYTLKNVKKENVYKAFDHWASSIDLPQATKNALRQQLNVRGSEEFKNAISKCIQWLADHKLKRYSLIVEIDGHVAKSSTWLAGPVIEGLKKRKIPGPFNIIPFYKGSKVSGSMVEKAVAAGVKTFVHVDDAIYSGSQKGILIKQLSNIVRNLKIGNYARLLIGAAYTTEVGKRYIESLVKPPLRLEFFAPHMIQSRSPVSTSNKHKNIIKSGGPTMTILSHKVPNAISFGPGPLSMALENALPRPVYKSMKFNLGGDMTRRGGVRAFLRRRKR